MKILSREQIDAIEIRYDGIPMGEIVHDDYACSYPDECSCRKRRVVTDDLIDTARAYHDSEKRFNDLRDAVLALFPEANDRGWGGGAVTIRNATCREVVREVVARVERGGS